VNVERWSVWLANLDPIVGSEQGKTRPVLVISRSKLNQILPVVNIIPLTSRKPGRRVYPNEALVPVEAAGLDRESIALCFQIRTLDNKRLIGRLGVLSDTSVQSEVLQALVFQLEVL
jgi:mRNA interferase MazF